MSKHKITWKETVTYELEVEAETTCEAFEKWLIEKKDNAVQLNVDDNIPRIEKMRGNNSGTTNNQAS